MNNDHRHGHYALVALGIVMLLFIGGAFASGIWWVAEAPSAERFFAFSTAAAFLVALFSKFFID